jgi:hypothetical protein
MADTELLCSHGWESIGPTRTDTLTRPARVQRDLAERGVVAVYPLSGCWKDQPKRDRSHLGARYALIVSVETPTVEADIWTPVAQQVGVPILIET